MSSVLSPRAAGRAWVGSRFRLLYSSEGRAGSLADSSEPPVGPRPGAPRFSALAVLGGVFPPNSQKRVWRVWTSAFKTLHEKANGARQPQPHRSRGTRCEVPPRTSLCRVVRAGGPRGVAEARACRRPPRARRPDSTDPAKRWQSTKAVQPFQQMELGQTDVHGPRGGGGGAPRRLSGRGTRLRLRA